MENYKTQFVKFLTDAGALKFGDFVTKSGRNSPYFINIGDLNGGKQLKQLGGFYADAIFSVFGSGITVLFGPAYKGIPIASVAAAEMADKFNADVKYSSLRKEIKEHGDTGAFLGYKPKSDDRVVIVEDVTTAGTSIRESMPELEKSGASVIGLVIAVDRMEKGKGENSALKETEQEFGIKTTAIVTLDEVLEVVGAGLSSDQLTKIATYRTQYGVK
jgi:orotate phosphoribosyltransferase